MRVYRDDLLKHQMPEAVQLGGFASCSHSSRAKRPLLRTGKNLKDAHKSYNVIPYFQLTVTSVDYLFHGANLCLDCYCYCSVETMGSVICNHQHLLFIFILAFKD